MHDILRDRLGDEYRLLGLSAVDGPLDFARHDDADVRPTLLDPPGKLNAIHVPASHDIRHDELKRMIIFKQFERVFSGRASSTSKPSSATMSTVSIRTNGSSSTTRAIG